MFDLPDPKWYEFVIVIGILTLFVLLGIWERARRHP
jgi:hypothetical protein